MFRLRLSQEVQVELICPQAKINFPTIFFPLTPAVAELCYRLFARRNIKGLFFSHAAMLFTRARWRGGEREGEGCRFGLDILYQHVATRCLIAGHNIPHWLPD